MSEDQGNGRVLHVITNLRLGGAEQQLARLVEESARDGAETRVIGVACLREGGAVADHLEACGVRVFRLGARGPVGFLRAARELGRLLRSERADVAVGWLYHAAIALSLPGVTPTGCRIAWNIRGTLPDARDRLGTRIAVVVARMLASRAARIVYNSEAARKEHERTGFPSDAGLVIANGFEMPKAGVRTPDSGEPLVALVARHHVMKDFPTFLKAIAVLRRSGVPVRAVLVGEGCDNTNGTLGLQLEASGARDFVTLAGAKPSVTEVYARATVVCSSSAWGEGFHNVLAEAALAGTLIVSTDVGEARTIVGDDRFVVPPGDPTALAESIRALLALPPEERRQLADERRDRIAAGYGIESMRRAYADLYRQLRIAAR